MTAPRHVLMTADTVGGVWTYSIEFVRALSKHGVRVSLATMGGPVTPSQRKEAASIEDLDLHESTYRLEWMEDPWDDVDRAGIWLLSLERRLKPDLVHLNGYVHGALDWAAPSVVVAHSCVLSWWNAVRESSAPPQWDEYKRRVRHGLRRADVVVGISRFIASELEKHYGPLDTVLTIYNSRDISSFPPMPKEHFVFSCGRVWDEAKNILTLDAAAKSAHWPVYVAGEERHPEGGQQTLQHARCIGKLSPPELRTWYGRAAIYALPARYEPFGLSVLEAALSGCALVLGDTASLREIWDDAALFVPPNNSDALATAINYLTCRDSVREEQARRARARALSYTPERMVQAYLGAYRQAFLSYQARAGLTCAS